MDDKFRSRKLAIAIWAAFVCSLGLFTDHLDSADFATCLIGIIGLYGLGNAIDKWKG